jgi:hypothetical protein
MTTRSVEPVQRRSAQADGCFPESMRSALRDRLAAGITPIVERLATGDQVVVTLPLLRRARSDPGTLAIEEPFSWKPPFVRRSLGLAVVEACATGRFNAPAEALEPVAAEAVAEWERTGWRTFHWEPWLAGLGPGARAAVLAEALSWATGLWSSLDWEALEGRPRFGGCDDQWVCPAPRTVRLKSRSEVRLAAAVGTVPRGGPAPAATDTLISVASGCPGREWALELAYLALVAALRSPSRPVPCRVTGLWPDAGLALTTRVDAPGLTAAADRVVATVAAVVASRLSTEPRR